MAALNPFERAALQKAVEAARGMNARYPYPALLTIAEWALASDWGHLQPGNNPFRIPAYPYCFGIQEWPKTNGGQRRRAAPRRVFYAVFEDLTQAFLKYEAMRVTTLGVHPHYFAYFQGEIDQEELARRVASEPGQAETLIAIMQHPEVQEAWQKTAPEVTLA